jgi:hypothetical protein
MIWVVVAAVEDRCRRGQRDQGRSDGATPRMLVPVMTSRRRFLALPLPRVRRQRLFFRRGDVDRSPALPAHGPRGQVDAKSAMANAPLEIRGWLASSLRFLLPTKGQSAVGKNRR